MLQGLGQIFYRPYSSLVAFPSIEYCSSAMAILPGQTADSKVRSLDIQTTLPANAEIFLFAQDASS